MDFWKGLVLLVLGILIGIGSVGVGQILFFQPEGEVIKLLPTHTPSPVVVYISGEVRKPGVYALPKGSRLIDLIRTAGGFKDSADPTLLDLASMLQDGENFRIPSAEEKFSTSDFPELVISENGLANTNSFGDGSNEPININLANKSQLESLPGIGPTLAQRIIDYRMEYGDFYDIEELTSVSGISITLVNELAAFITVK